MNTRSVWTAAIAATLLAAGAASAQTDPADPATEPAAAPSAFALPVTDLSVTAPAAAPSLAVTVQENPILAGARQFESIRYRTRRRRYDDYDRPRGYGATSQIHAGFFDPSGDLGTGFLLGFRAGPLVDPHVQLGVGLDWWHKSDSQTIRFGEGTGPGGVPTQLEREISRWSANLIPILGYIQLSGDESMSVVPYGGAGVGYQALFLSGDDFDTGEEFDATYGGFDWQLWGGVAIPLSGQSRFVGEVFWNGGEVGRDVEDTTTGDTFREVVDMDGVGARFGFNWGF